MQSTSFQRMMASFFSELQELLLLSFYPVYTFLASCHRSMHMGETLGSIPEHLSSAYILPLSGPEQLSITGPRVLPYLFQMRLQERDP